MQLRGLFDLELGRGGVCEDALQREHFVVELLSRFDDLLEVEVVVPVAQHVERVVTVERSGRVRGVYSRT